MKQRASLISLSVSRLGASGDPQAKSAVPITGGKASAVGAPGEAAVKTGVAGAGRSDFKYKHPLATCRVPEIKIIPVDST